MKASAYQYESLASAEHWIRTLIIDPQSSLENIVCNLVPTPLEEEHICLSYTWGEQVASHKITVNGRVLLVRQNLLDFLKECLRDQALVGLPLWIDAVCINQNDLTEKNRQVAQMGKIYAKAKKVIVWLGCGEDQVTEAVRHVQAYMNSPLVDSDSLEAQEIDVGNGVTKNLSQKDYSGTSLRTYWNNFDAIANLAYWKRAWIMQELLSARDSEIWYGERRIEWWMLIEYHSFVKSHAGPEGCDPYLGDIKVTRSSCGWLLRRLAYKEEVQTFTMLPFSLALAQMRQECFDKRDLVYACRALDEDLESVPIDYKSDPCMLLPALFDSNAIKSDFIYMGMLIIDRLGLGLDKTIKITYNYLPEKTWTTDIINIGVVIELEKVATNSMTVGKIDWSAFAYFVKAQDSLQVDDGVGSLTYTTQSWLAGNSSRELRPDDMVCHIQMVGLLLVFRRSRPVAIPRDFAPYLSQKAAAEYLSGYELVAFFESKTMDGQRLESKKDHMNVLIHSLNETKVTHLFLELSRSRFKVGTLGYSIELQWRALLRIWELRDTGLVKFKPKMLDVVGSWDEEEAKIKALSIESR